MSELYTTLTQITKENTQKRIEKTYKKQVEYAFSVNQTMDKLYESIMNSGYEENMKKAAVEGYNKCTLFEFQKGAIYEGFPLIFLTRGPPRNKNNIGGFQYFENNGIVSYIVKLQKEFPEFKIGFHTNKSYETTVEISWV